MTLLEQLMDESQAVGGLKAQALVVQQARGRGAEGVKAAWARYYQALEARNETYRQCLAAHKELTCTK